MRRGLCYLAIALALPSSCAQGGSRALGDNTAMVRENRICARRCWYPVALQLHLGFAKVRTYTILYDNVPRHVGCPLCVPWPREARAHRWGYGTGVIPAFTNTAFRPLGRMALQLGRDLILLAQSNKQDHGVAYRIAEPKRIKASDRKKVGHSLCRAVPQSG